MGTILIPTAVGKVWAPPHLLSWPTPTAISLPDSLKTINLSSIRCVPRFQLLNLAHISRTYTHTILGTSHTHTHLAHHNHNPSHNMQGTPSVLPSNATSGPDAVNPAHIPYMFHTHVSQRLLQIVCCTKHLHFSAAARSQMRPRARCASMCVRVPP
jgi:hypothetical protein